MEATDLLIKSVIEGIHDKKGRKVSKIKLEGLSGVICDYFIICEGGTPSQVSAIADSIESVVKKNTSENPIRVQGQQKSEWIGIDYGDVMVHVFLPELRSYYNLDHLWGDAHLETIPLIY